LEKAARIAMRPSILCAVDDAAREVVEELSRDAGLGRLAQPGEL
jgi:hypothetical protein